jgi:cell division protein FtsL
MSPPPATAAATAVPAVRPQRRGPGRAAPARGPARPTRPTRPARPTARPRRISGPARAGAAKDRLREPTAERLIGRLIWNPPARAWIAVVATALIGIVAMQVWVVKLGAGIGRAVEHAATLQRENTELAAENSALGSGERIEGMATARGMAPAPPGALHFLRVQGKGQDTRDVRLAVEALERPAPPATPAAAPEPATATATTAAAPATQAAAPEPATATATTATTATAPAETPAAAPEPAAAGGTSEESTSAATGAGGGTQAPPGG